MTMISKLFILSLCITALSANDDDMDGVPNHLDQCKNTPFFHEVDANGCSSAILKLPQDASNGLYLTLGYGFSHNEDLREDEEKQYSSSLEFNYYHNDWNYALRVGYANRDRDDGSEDILFQIKRNFLIKSNLKLSLGVGIKLPTYDFEGNEADYLLQSSLIYYYNTTLSFFGGIGYEFISDEDNDNPLQNIASFYLGSGYFFSDDLYANLSYSYKQSKFSNQHAINLLQTTLFYKLNDNYFVTLSYGHQIFDHDLHNALSMNIGYTFW